MQIKAPPENFGGRSLGNFPKILEIFDKINDSDALYYDFFTTIEALKEDSLRALDYLSKDSSNDFWRRTVIKTMCVWIEGQAFAMKRVALEQDKLHHVGFTIAELAILREDKYHLKENGEVTCDQKGYLKVTANLKFAFKSFARAYGKTFEFDLKGFKQFEDLEKVRNRLTHPKAAAVLVVSDTEIQLATTVLQWFVDETTKALNLCYQQGNVPLPIRYDSIRPRINLTMPWLLYWPDATAFEFPTEEAALEFATANGANVEKQDCVIFGPYPEA